MLKPTFLSLILLAVFSFTAFTGSANAANYEVVELSPTHLMIVPKTWALEEEKGAKLILISYRETFKDALAALSTRYKMKSIIPIEGFAAKEELIKAGGSITICLILEVEKR